MCRVPDDVQCSHGVPCGTAPWMWMDVVVGLVGCGPCSLRSDFHSVAHAVLASLPCSDVVTTNYDDLFEKAVEGVRTCQGWTPGVTLC